MSLLHITAMGALAVHESARAPVQIRSEARNPTYFYNSGLPLACERREREYKRTGSFGYLSRPGWRGNLLEGHRLVKH